MNSKNEKKNFTRNRKNMSKDVIFANCTNLFKNTRNFYELTPTWNQRRNAPFYSNIQKHLPFVFFFLVL